MRPAVAPISQTQRLELIRRVHDDASIPLQDRVVALLILLYAQPLIKIARLTVADIELDAGEVRLHLGGEPVPIIPPFSTVLLDHIATRSNQTATNPASTLLFPGRSAGQPIHPGSPRLRLHRLGIPNVNGRTRAIRELLIQARPRSSPACSATTRPVPNCLPPRPAQPGNVTHQAITHVMTSRDVPEPAEYAVLSPEHEDSLRAQIAHR